MCFPIAMFIHPSYSPSHHLNPTLITTKQHRFRLYLQGTLCWVISWTCLCWWQTKCQCSIKTFRNDFWLIKHFPSFIPILGRSLINDICYKLCYNICYNFLNTFKKSWHSSKRANVQTYTVIVLVVEGWGYVVNSLQRTVHLESYGQRCA